MNQSMNRTLTSFCLDAFDQSLSTPIGCAIKCNYESLPFLPTNDINIFILRDRLISRNYYNSPESFIVDLQTIINQACDFFGTESDMAIALLSLQYSIQNFLQPVLKLRENISTNNTESQTGDENNYNADSKWEKSKNKLLENLNNFLDVIPNDVGSFKAFTHPIENAPYVDNEEHEKFPNPDVNIDLLDLKSRIDRLDSDKDVYELMDIIENHQPELPSSFGNIRFDLKSLHPHTLYLINEFVKKCKLRPPPPTPITNSDKIQRSQSLPIRKSSSSSTIILQNPLHNKSYQQQQELQQQVQNQQQQIQNQFQAQLQSFQAVAQQQPPQFPTNGNFFNSTNMNLKSSLQSITQQQQLQLQLKNINSYNLKNNRNNNSVTFSHQPSTNSLDPQEQSQISPSNSSSLIGLTTQQQQQQQPCFVSPSQQTNNAASMMSNITVQPSTMPSISPQQQHHHMQQQQQQQKQKRQYKSQSKQKNQFINEIQQNAQNSFQMQMQLQQQQQQQIGPDTQQFSPFLKEAISYARMNKFMMMPDMGIQTQQSELQQQQQQSQQQSAPFSAPPTPGSQRDSAFNTNAQTAATTTTATTATANVPSFQLESPFQAAQMQQQQLRAAQQQKQQSEMQQGAQTQQTAFAQTLHESLAQVQQQQQSPQTSLAQTLQQPSVSQPAPPTQQQQQQTSSVSQLQLAAAAQKSAASLSPVQQPSPGFIQSAPQQPSPVQQPAQGQAASQLIQKPEAASESEPHQNQAESAVAESTERQPANSAFTENLAPSSAPSATADSSTQPANDDNNSLNHQEQN